MGENQEETIMEKETMEKAKRKGDLYHGLAALNN